MGVILIKSPIIGRNLYGKGVINMLKVLWRGFSDLIFNDLKVTLTTTPKPKPKDYANIAWGSVFTDHMLEVDWHEGTGWEAPEIKPYQNLRLDPSSSVFHYSTECYEGFKVYNNPPHILSFRPMMNMERLSSSSEAAGLPRCNPHELLKCIDELIRIEKEWVPDLPGYSLYVRPNMFGTHAQLSVTKPKSAKLTVISTPVGPYFPTGFKAMSLYCDDKYVRAWPGGHGNKKLGGNYAPGIALYEEMKKKGYGQILWLSDGKVTECGVMNFFVLWKVKGGLELITSSISNTVLPGVTRDSIIQLAHEWGEFRVTEREFSMAELVEAMEQGRVVEAFGSGTAATLVPINLIHYKDKDYTIPTKLGPSGELTQKIYDELNKIFYGKVRHKWNHYIA